MNRKIAAALLAAGIAGGSAAVSTSAAFADDADQPGVQAPAQTSERNGWATSAIKPLVDNGTLNQSQSDAVVKALDDARPMRKGRGNPPDFTAVASLFGMSADQFHAATRDANKSIADLAKEKNVDLQKVIDAIVAAHNARLDEDVKSGKLTQAEADARKADAAEHVKSMVNETHPQRGGRGIKGVQGGGTSSSTSTTPAAL